MKLAEKQPERHCQRPNKRAAGPEMLRGGIASAHAAVRADRFSLVPSEAGAPSSVQQAG